MAALWVPCALRLGLPLTSSLDSRMRKLLLSAAVLLTSLACQAGYSEYQFLALSACKAFMISTDTVPPDVNSSRASPEYKAYVSAKGPNNTWIWGLYDAPQYLEHWADCQETEKEISCVVIGPFRYSSFTCPLGASKQWSRACTATGGQPGELKIYSVDTREYETGGRPIVNQYWHADRKKFAHQCHQPTAPR